jgi:lysophospholipase L1-like esterase
MGLLLAGCILSLAEVCLRLTLGPPPPAVKVFSRSKNEGGWFQPASGRILPAYQGQLGDRSRVALIDGGFDADSQEKRFAVLGGSVVHGGTPHIRTRWEFPNLLGKALGARGINLGSPGLDSHDLVGIAEELRSYRMDAWVVYTGHNDFGNGYFLQRYQGWPGGIRAHGRSVLESLQLFWQVRRLSQRAISRGILPDPGHQFDAPQVTPDQKTHILMDYLRNMRRLIWLAGQAEVPLVLVVPAGALTMPPLGACEDGEALELWEQGMAQRAEQTDPARLSLQRARDADCVPLRMVGAAQEGLRDLGPRPHVSLVDAARGLPRESDLDIAATSLFADHVHLSKAGHRALAELIAPTLQAVLPSPTPQ